MSDKAFRELLDLLMVSDPEPVVLDHLKAFAEQEAKRRGHDDWISAYHEFKV